jgi:hypothetical protein
MRDVRHGRRPARRGIAIAVLALAAGAAWAAPSGARIALLDCAAQGPTKTTITAVLNMPCGAAVQDLTAYGRPLAISFRTPGGFTCTRTVRQSRRASYRCVSGPRVYRFVRSGTTRPAIRVMSGGFDSTFTVTVCRSRGRAKLILNGRGPAGMRVRIRPGSPGGGTIVLRAPDPENGVDASGSISALRIGRDGSISATGRFSAGGTAAFRVIGDCR